MKKQLGRIANTTYPRIAVDVQTIRKRFNEPEILQMFGRTKNDRYLLYIETIIEPEYSFVLFASSETLQIIRQHILVGSRRYLMDGTFDAAPKTFKQLLTICVEFCNDVCEMYSVQ